MGWWYVSIIQSTVFSDSIFIYMSLMKWNQRLNSRGSSQRHGVRVEGEGLGLMAAVRPACISVWRLSLTSSLRAKKSFFLLGYSCLITKRQMETLWICWLLPFIQVQADCWRKRASSQQDANKQPRHSIQQSYKELHPAGIHSSESGGRSSSRQALGWPQSWIALCLQSLTSPEPEDPAKPDSDSSPMKQ